MRNIFLILTCSLGLTANIQAQQTKKINITELPEKAQTFIKKNFNKEKTQYVLKEVEDFFDIEYKVAFLDKVKIKFNKKGEWKEIDGNRTPIPTQLIPEKILAYVRKSFPNNEVVKIEKDKRRYEVKISNGLDLEFDSKGDFLRIDS